MTMPTISVVTVTLNAERHLPGLLHCLRAQTDRAFDFVVVDGLSKDGTWEKLREADDLITYRISESDNGFYDALNKAVRAVATDYYLDIGADDRLEPDAIANYKKLIERRDLDLVVAGVRVGEKILPGCYRPENHWRGPHAMITSHSVGTLIRTALHQQFGAYSSKYSLLADSLFLKRVCLAAATKIEGADFVAGTFDVGGISNQNIAKALFESWQVQLETGENPLVQFFLYQSRLLRFLPKILKS